jgi:septum site-determining protein MinC
VDVGCLMAAELIPSHDCAGPHLLTLPPWSEAGAALSEVRDALLLQPALRGTVTLRSGLWPLRTGDYCQLMDLLAKASLSLGSVCCQEEGARVAAASLGLVVERDPMDHKPVFERIEPAFSDSGGSTALSIHQGTVRAGDHRQVTGSLLVLGDVNPGALISATGHVMVWGKLRGIAHAGQSGDRTARIVALHLHPLQLRIADQVARGPAEAPPAGLAEKAHLVNGQIKIDPADPSWPLGGVPATLPGQSSGVRGGSLA